MASAVVGALRVNLGLDSAQFQKGLTQSQSRLQKFGSAVKTGMKVAAAAVAAAFAGMSLAVRSALKDFDNLAKTSQAIGIPVEQLSALAHAADLSGVAFDQLSTGMRKLSQNMVTVAQGSISDVARAFTALGIAVQGSDGQLKSSTDIMAEVADKFARMEDGAAKTGLAMAIFGRAGAALIPMLNQGSGGIDAMTEEALRLGLVIDTKTAKAAERFNDQMTRVRAVGRGFVNMLTAAMLPTLEVLANAFFGAAKDGDTLRHSAANIGRWFANLALLTADLSKRLDIVARNFIAVGQAAKAAATGNFSEAIGIIRSRMDGATADAQLFRLEMMRLKNELMGIQKASLLDVDDRPPRKFVVNWENASGAIGKAAKAAANATKDAARDAAKAAELMGRKFEEAGKMIGGLIAGTLTWRDALAQVLSALATAALKQATLGSLGGAGSLLSGIVGGLFGFAKGGSFQVGGSGGSDSQLVAFRASPNEMVDVRTPGQNRMNDGGQSFVDIRVTPTKLFDVEVERIAGPVSVRTSAAMIGQAQQQQARMQRTGAA